MARIVPYPDKPYFIQSRSSALVLDVDRASKEPGARVLQWECHKGSNQQWYFEAVAEDVYNIRNANSGLYLQFGDGPDNVGKLIQAAKNGRDSQRFALTPGILGGVVLRSERGKAIEVPGTDTNKGTQLRAWDASGELNQSFYLCTSIPTRLRLIEVQCFLPSSGIYTAANTTAGDVSTLGGAGLGVLGAGLAIAGVATGGVALAVVGASVGVAGAGALLAGWIDGAAGGEDDLYIEVDGKRIWPVGKKHDYIKKGQSLKLNLKLSDNWSSSSTLQLWEHDTISSDDELTKKITLDPVRAMWNSEFTVVTGNDSEGSLYGLTFIFT